MGNSTSKDGSANSIIVDLYASETTNQLLKTHLTNQRIADVLKHPTSTISSTMSTPTYDRDIVARVWNAQCKIYGYGTQSKNEEEGLRELEELSDYKEAAYPLGCYYYDQQNYEKAYTSFRKIRKEDPAAQYRLALMLFHGQGVEVNHQKAFHYMKMAATNDNKYAQFILGFYYEYGILVKQSISTSKMWYERSAKQGFAEAQTAIANLLLNQMDVDTKLIDLSVENQIMRNQALNWLWKAIEQENASALIRLGALHEEGLIVPKDNKKTMELYTRATKAPFVSNSVRALAHYLVGVKYRTGEPDLEQDFGEAITHLSISADAGYAPAQRILGLMFAEGIGTPQSETRAKYLFEKAAAQGDIRSMGLLNNYHQYHQQPSNMASALILYEKSAKAGSLAAQLSLADLLQRTGQHDMAFKWFEMASKNTPAGKQKRSILDFSVGFVSQRNLARLMVARYRYNGWGNVKQDRLWAFEEFQTLSNNGYSDALYWLAACYEEGVPADNHQQHQEWIVQPDLDLAFQYYIKSAESGDMDGQFQVAYMLSNGIGVKKDINAAFPWYTKSAEQGHKTAQYSLAMYYENGLGVPVDLVKAKKWYQLAAAELPMAMVRLAKVMVLSDKSEAEDAAEWLQKAIDLGDVAALRELANLYKDNLIGNNKDDNTSSLENFRVAFNYYQKAADKDDAPSWFALSKFYDGEYDTEDEIVVPNSFSKAVMCLRKAEDLGHPGATLELADLYHRHEKTQDAMIIYAELAVSQNTSMMIVKRACIEAAKIVVYEGYGDKADESRVYTWLADFLVKVKGEGLHVGELSEVYELLGFCTEHGLGTEVDRDEAIKLYVECAHEKEHDGHEHWARERALCRLSYFYMEGQDYVLAFTYLDMLKHSLEDMSELPSDDAIQQARRMKFFLGYLLLRGLGTHQDIHQGLYWLAQASDDGEGDAAYEMGIYYAHLKNDGTADEEMRLRFQQGTLVGHPGCMREMAFMLLSEEADKSVMDEDYDGGAEILDLLQTAAQLGDSRAMYQLGCAYEEGLGDVIPEKDVEKAVEWYMKAGAESHEEGMLKAGELLGTVLGQHEQAIDWFRRAAEKFDNIKAKVMLISYSFQGMSFREEERSDQQDFEELQVTIDREINFMKNFKENDVTQREARLRLSKKGLALAFYILGQCYELGRGTSVNISLAKEWYHRSVIIAEHADAMWRLGVICCEVESNYAKALEWFRMAAEKGKHRESHYQLGLFHLHGLGDIEVNTVVAKKHFSKAAEQGHALATYELGRIVWYKENDYHYGYELFKVAGQQFHVPAALRELGHISHSGFSAYGITICEQSYKAAFAFYCEAAQQGDAISALMVGNYFEEGYLQEELGHDYERALQWYESAYRLECGGLSELAIGKLKHTMAETIEDPKKAEDMREEAYVWFEGAANSLGSGNSYYSARVMMALYHLNGWGRKLQDTQAGLQMLLEIADLGGSEALIPIAQCYEEGVGVEYDMNKAQHYWEMAAELDIPEALERLGDFYRLGLSGKIDKALANTYYDRAKVLTNKSAAAVTAIHPENRRHSDYSLDSIESL